jgi:ferritin-like metal-binding protein YciE
MATQPTRTLVKHLDEAVAMERGVLRQLDSMLRTTDDSTMRTLLEEHQRTTRQHIKRLEERLEAHGASPSLIRNTGGAMLVGGKVVVDLVRTRKPARNARDAFATENLEVASYELLERVAAKAGDKETVEAARKNKAEDREMAGRIDEGWDRYVDLSLGEGREAGGGRSGIARSIASLARNPVAIGIGSVALGAALGRRGQQRRPGESAAGGTETSPAALSKLPKSELQRRAEDAGVEVRPDMTKQELIDALNERVQTSKQSTQASRRSRQRQPARA